MKTINYNGHELKYENSCISHEFGEFYTCVLFNENKEMVAQLLITQSEISKF